MQHDGSKSDLCDGFLGIECAAVPDIEAIEEASVAVYYRSECERIQLLSAFSIVEWKRPVTLGSVVYQCRSVK